MIRPMRPFFTRSAHLVALMIAASLPGCDRTNPPSNRAARPAGPLAIRRPDTALKVFTGQDDPPGASLTFQGAVGSVRVTMEIEGASGPLGMVSPPQSLNDVLFKAEGDGRISVDFRRPWPDHPNGRVTIRCLSGGEESSADFEPELWYHLPGAIVTVEPTPSDAADPVVPGKEALIGRYVARNVPRDVRLTFKAVFTAEPLLPRTKAGLKPPH
jgi:hypothetical protein